MDEIVVARKLLRDSTRVIYRFPLGFEIHATKNGVAFTGSSANFNIAGLVQVTRVIRWAGKIAQELAAGRGIVPQDELTHKIVLKTRATNFGYQAWWVGQASRHVVRGTKDEAVAALRSIYNQLNEPH